MKKILITGCAGYVGKILSQVFLKKNYLVFGIDNLSRSNSNDIKFLKQNKNFKFYKLDYSNIKLINIIKKNNICDIIHLAAYINVSESERLKKKYLNNNIEKLIIFFKNLKDIKLKNFIFASTCAILNSDQSNFKPTSIYALTKLIGENLIKFYSNKYNFNFCCLRYFNVVGADLENNLGKVSKSDHLFSNIINSIKKNKLIKIYGKNFKTKDGTCERDYIHVVDLSTFHLDVLNYMKKNKSSKLFINYGYNKKTSVLQVVKNFNKFLNKPLKYKFINKRLGDPESLYLKRKNKIISKIHKFKYNSLSLLIKSELKFNKLIK